MSNSASDIFLVYNFEFRLRRASSTKYSRNKGAVIDFGGYTYYLTASLGHVSRGAFVPKQEYKRC